MRSHGTCVRSIALLTVFGPKNLSNMPVFMLMTLTDEDQSLNNDGLIGAALARYPNPLNRGSESETVGQ